MVILRCYYDSLSANLILNWCNNYWCGKQQRQRRATQQQSDGASSRGQRSGLPTVVVSRLVEPAQLADGADPLVHVLHRLRHEVEGPVRGLDVKHEAVLELLPLKGQAAVHLLAAVQVDDPDGFLGVVILVVLKDVGVTAHAAAAKDEPAFLPRLGRSRESRKGKNVRIIHKKKKSSTRPQTFLNNPMMQNPEHDAECCSDTRQQLDSGCGVNCWSHLANSEQVDCGTRTVVCGLHVHARRRQEWGSRCLSPANVFPVADVPPPLLCDSSVTRLQAPPASTSDEWRCLAPHGIIPHLHTTVWLQLEAWTHILLVMNQ